MNRFPAIALSLTLALAAAAPATAQRIGVKGGLGITNLAGADAETLDATTGFTGGAWLRVSATPLLSLQPELLFARKGAKMQVDNQDGSVRIDYLTVPLLLDVAVPVPPTVGIRPHVMLGPSFNFRVGCNFDGADGSTACDDAGFGNQLDFKSFDLSGVVGGGVDVPVGGITFVVDGRYDFGLTKVDDSGAGRDIKMRGVAFMAGFQLPLGGRSLAYR